MTGTSRDEFLLGVRDQLPVLAAAAPIGLLFGALAVQKGLTPLETVLMSAIVFAGSAQFVAIEIWREPAPWLTLAATALVINLRHVMMGASLARSLGRFGPRARWSGLFLLTDETWALAERRARLAPLTTAYYFGLALSLYVNWNVFTLIGALVGNLLSDPARFGFDFAFAALFIGLIVGFWKGRETGLVVLASALAAIVVEHHVEGTWYIIAGAAAGMSVAALLAWRVSTASPAANATPIEEDGP
ncbi:MAG: branched-chain amino acid ABC transporter permease [Rhizobiales bacterium]|nr:branched-chain amino acid ABC transporter permease [Hyphomicrobiales bacterium]